MVNGDGRSQVKRFHRSPLNIQHSAFVFLGLLVALMAGAADAQPSWRALPATGVQMSLQNEGGVVRVDFDFQGHGGYAIARRDAKIALPENFELAFRMKAETPRNTLEVKFIRGEDVWWSVRRELDFPREWKRFSVRKRDVEFAWGPGGPAPLPPVVDAIEIVVTAGMGGKGTMWLDDVSVLPLDTAPPGPLPKVCNVPFRGAGPFVVDLGARREFGAVIIDWEEAPSRYELATSLDGKAWDVVRRVEATNGGRDALHLPDGDARYLRLDFDRGAIRDVRLLPPLRTDNDFFAALAKESPRGDFPRYFTGEQSYWTVLGGIEGEDEEVLLGEDGAVEVGSARFTIEPFLWVDGKRLVTWADVDIEQACAEGAVGRADAGVADDPSASSGVDESASGAAVDSAATGCRPIVRWNKYLTITPRVDNGILKVRYVTARNANLFLAIRPFQVNTPWQFLKRTGGTVKIPRIERRADGSVLVEADRDVVIDPVSKFGATTYDGGDVVEFLRRGVLPPAQSLADPNGYASAAMEFDAEDVTISIPLGSSVPEWTRSLRAGPEAQAQHFSLHLPADPRIEETLLAQLQYILINRDGASIQPGSRSYERSWIRDGSLTSTALLRLGHGSEVREFLEWYARFVQPDGRVPCCVGPPGADPVPEHDSHGQFLYLVAEDYRFTKDRSMAEAMWPVVERVVRHIESLRAQRMTEAYRGTEFYGLVPESISHEGYSAKPMHSYWDDLFILRGLKDAAFLAKELGRPDARRYETLRDDFRRTLAASIAKTMTKHGIDYIPGSADLGDFDATSTTVLLDPVAEAAALPAAAVRRTFDRYLEHALEPREYTPYELRIVGALVRLRRGAEARRLLDYFFADQRPQAWRQWAEVVRPNPRQGGFVGDMPHTWVGSDFIRSALDLFAFEEGDRLVLAAGVSEEWARKGMSVRGLGTYHGPLDYSMTADGDGLRVRIEDTVAVPPGGIVIVSPLDGAETVVRALPADVRLTSTERNEPNHEH
jgi:hypothetical protein